jgi:hypothetical protein
MKRGNAVHSSGAHTLVTHERQYGSTAETAPVV